MAAVIGGAGTLMGPIIGSVFLVILSEIFALTLGEAHLIIFGILFILVVLFLPRGLMGGVDMARTWMYRMWRVFIKPHKAVM
jgi:branched-chain amino acid transport system permease protein